MNIRLSKLSSIIAIKPGTALFFTVLIGALLRLAGLSGELWLDEVWSLENVTSLSSLGEIFTSLKTDNNHVLTSIWMFLAANETSSPLWVRGLSGTFAILSVGVIWLLGRYYAGARGIAFSILLSTSYVMVLYSTEARGYSGLIFCVLACIWVSQHTSKGAGVFLKVVLNILCVLGIVSHFSFLKFFIPCVAWHFWQICMFRGVRASAIATTILFLPSLIFYALLYVFYISHLPAGTGPLRSHFEVICNTFSVAIGGPQMHPDMPLLSLLVIVIAVLVAAFSMRAALELKHDRKASWALYSIGLFVIPVLVLVLLKPRVLFVRYFIVEIILFYCVASYWCGKRWQEGVKSKAVVAVLLSGFVLANGSYLSQFFSHDRGSYREIVAEVVANRDGEEILFASDEPPFRHMKMLNYYSKQLGQHNTFRQVSPVNVQTKSDEVPEWLFTHDVDGRYSQPEQREFNGRMYVLKRHSQHAPLSGFSWYLYSLQKVRTGR